MIKLANLIVMMIFLTGCNVVRPEKPLTYVRNSVGKFQDGKVTCYILKDDGQKVGSISCLEVLGTTNEPR